MSKNNQNNPAVIVSHLGTVSTAGDYPICNLPRRFVLVSVQLLDQAGIAANDTDYVTLTLKRGSTSLASLDTRAANQGAVTANVSKSFSLVAAEQELAAGDLKLTYAEGGTGTLTLAKVQVNGFWA